MTAALTAAGVSVASLGGTNSVPAVMSTLLAGVVLLGLRAVLGVTGRAPSRRAAYLLDAAIVVVVVAFAVLVVARFETLD